ncbi:MAG: DnaJ domain-containing protein [Clostridium sp.]
MDPYRALGVTPDATKDEILKAYKSVVNQYSLEKYADTPLQPLAEEKLLDANEAYEILINGNVYTEVRNLLQQRNFIAAETKLNLIYNPNNAEWNFLHGFVLIQKGWYDAGLQEINTAYDMNPDNPEYIDTIYKLRQQANNFKSRYNTTNNNAKQGGGNDMCGGGGGGGSNGGMC